MERTTVGSILRAAQAWCLQLCEKQTLDFGIAYYSHRFPQLPAANQFREVIAESPQDVAAAFDEASRWFAQKQLCCRRWAPATGDASAALENLLLDRGFSKRIWTALALTQWPRIARSDRLRILPARAMRHALSDLLRASAADHGAAHRDAEARAWLERLDEPQLDLFVAMAGSVPVAFAGLFQVGDVAQVLFPRGAAQASPAGAGESLMAHTLGLARRLTITNVVTTLPGDDTDGHAWLERLGFVPDGTVVEFDRVDQAENP